jgi:WD40 repeat protein
VTAGIDGKIITWNLNSGHLSLIMREPHLDNKQPDEKCVEGIVFLYNPNAEEKLEERQVVLASCHGDGFVRFWDTERGIMIYEVSK